MRSWHLNVNDPWSGRQAWFESDNFAEFVAMAQRISADWYSKHGIWAGFYSLLPDETVFESAWTDRLVWLALCSKNPHFGICPQSQSESNEVRACMPRSGELEVFTRCGRVDQGIATLSRWLRPNDSHVIVNSLEASEIAEKARGDDTDLRAYWSACRVPCFPLELTCGVHRRVYTHDEFEGSLVQCAKAIVAQSVSIEYESHVILSQSDGNRFVVARDSTGVRLTCYFSRGGWGTMLQSDQSNNTFAFEASIAKDVLMCWLLYGWFPAKFAEIQVS